MNSLALPLSALLLAGTAQAVEPVKVDVYLGDRLEQHIALSGPNSGYLVWVNDEPRSVLELRLVAPEPIILEVKETLADQETPTAQGRVKLVGAGGRMALEDLKGTKFQHDFVLIRPE